MAKFASGMDFGVVLRIALELLRHSLAFWSGIPIKEGVEVLQKGHYPIYLRHRVLANVSIG
jgi:hypothetical protein